MNQFEMVFGIVLIVMIGSVLRAWLGVRRGRRDGLRLPRDSAGDDRLVDEIRALRDEVKKLKERQAVIERITVEKENSLEREIDRLRDH